MQWEHKNSNVIGFGFDEGSVVVKVEMINQLLKCYNGKVLYAKEHVNLQRQSQSNILWRRHEFLQSHNQSSLSSQNNWVQQQIFIQLLYLIHQMDIFFGICNTK